ncbi:MAG: tetraacyldisaccharide 4'-kinase [Flavobacteriia bacterium]|nr:tetraacyldisaccharide 4'-kinase [Flavobacteriia bacterium]
MRRPWLLPFAPLYWIGVSIRNSLFDIGILKQHSFDVPILCIGNLSAGGTGKTPHTEWVLNQFQDKFKIVVLSRGYGRKTKGYLEVKPSNKASEVGDEPLQISQRFPKVKVVVCEDRVFAIETILSSGKKPNLIVLDDAYQHRYVDPGLTWLLTPYFDLYTKDFILPLGNLREDVRGADRADMITVTKCPGEPTPEERERIRHELNPTEIQLLSFSRMKYEELVNVNNSPAERPAQAVVVTGIAEPAPLLKHLRDLGTECIHVQFKDHRDFTFADTQRIKSACEKLDHPFIITTRKDFVRWPEDEELRAIPTLVQDIAIELDGDEGIVARTIERFVTDFKSDTTS